jgi:Holliday junction DNA helicase RuvB
MQSLPTLTSICSKCGKTFYHDETDISNLCLYCEFPDVEKKKDNPQEIVIKPELLDTSKLEEGTQKFLWRPENFEQYVGQNSLKEILKGYIRGCKELNKPFPHFLVSGKAGGGKTAIAYILAKELGLNFVECTANSIKSSQQLLDKIVEVNSGILFLDELQVIGKNVANFILPIMEDFNCSGKHIKPFTIFSATTELGVLLKKYKPLVDRFRINKVLDKYTIEELTLLIKQYKDKTFPNVSVDNSALTSIASNCRNTPRIAIRLLESYIYMNKPLNDVYKAYNIVKNGIVEDDVKVLNLLVESGKGLGLNSICAYLQTSQENFIYSMESYLLEQGLMTIGTRRQITEAGRDFLNSLKGG